MVKPGARITQAIQVTCLLNLDTQEREISGLTEAMQEYNLPEGMLLYYDREKIDRQVAGNIKMIPVWKWLLRE